MKLYYSIIATLVLATTAHAESWVYHATLPTQVQVYVDTASIRTVAHTPEIRSAQVSLGRPGQDAETITVEAACAVRGIRSRPDAPFSVTQPDKTMGLLVARLCNK